MKRIRQIIKVIKSKLNKVSMAVILALVLTGCSVSDLEQATIAALDPGVSVSPTSILQGTPVPEPTVAVECAPIQTEIPSTENPSGFLVLKTYDGHNAFLYEFTNETMTALGDGEQILAEFRSSLGYKNLAYITQGSNWTLVVEAQMVLKLSFHGKLAGEM